MPTIANPRSRSLALVMSPYPTVVLRRDHVRVQ